MPILDPAECTLLLLNTCLSDQSAPSPPCNLSRCYRLIHAAALAAAVPVYTATCQDRPGNEQATSRGSPTNATYHYSPGMMRALWSDRGLAQNIAGTKRSCLILAGCWLEIDVTFVALIALADGFDAHVCFDASPSQHVETRQIAIDRILQAGAVPLCTIQMIHEWAERSPDDERRRALLHLLASDQGAPIGAHA